MIDATITEHVACDFLISVIRGYFGLLFEVVDSSPQGHFVEANLTSGSVRLHLSIDDASNLKKHRGSIIEAKIFGYPLNVSCEFDDGNILHYTDNAFEEAVQVAVVQSRNSCLYEVVLRCVTIELPDFDPELNNDIALQLASESQGYLIGIPTYFGRLPNGQIFCSDEDARGKARYVQINFPRGKSVESLRRSWRDLLELPAEFQFGRKTKGSLRTIDTVERICLLGRTF
jgi:hypothetical protein